MRIRSNAGILALTLLCAGVHIAHAGAAQANAPQSLYAKYKELQGRLNHNAFNKPFFLDSSETQGGVQGDMYALVSHPFAMVGAALSSADNWCDILLLHLNTKYCRASKAGEGNVLNVSIGKKYDQPLDEAYRIVFDYRVVTQASNYLQVRLNADKGPLSTRNYRIVLEAIPMENQRTFIHLSYSYGFGWAGRTAMKTYLATTGRNKVGFTVAGTQPGGGPHYVRGMRGVVERNTMRYYLAIEAFLGALSEPAPARLEKRLHDWFAAIERYPRQLHELEQSEYLGMKRKEYRRHQAE
ncbi:MAG: hypothetical protein ACKVQA_09825 [Burkholderiales bacterium]